MSIQASTHPIELGTDAPQPPKLLLWVSTNGELALSEGLPSPGFWKCVCVEEADEQRFDIWARRGRARLIHEPLIKRETYESIRAKIGQAG